jgi:hypothetical protein
MQNIRIRSVFYIVPVVEGDGIKGELGKAELGDLLLSESIKRLR